MGRVFTVQALGSNAGLKDVRVCGALVGFFFRALGFQALQGFLLGSRVFRVGFRLVRVYGCWGLGSRRGIFSLGILGVRA